MTLERFTELWIAAGLNNMPKIENPLMTDTCSPHLEKALLDAADGDFTIFDNIEDLVSKR